MLIKKGLITALIVSAGQKGSRLRLLIIYFFREFLLANLYDIWQSRIRDYYAAGSRSVVAYKARNDFAPFGSFLVGHLCPSCFLLLKVFHSLTLLSIF